MESYFLSFLLLVCGDMGDAKGLCIKDMVACRNGVTKTFGVETEELIYSSCLEDTYLSWIKDGEIKVIQDKKVIQ